MNVSVVICHIIMYFITESTAIECGCVLGGTLDCFLHGVVLHESFQRECVCIYFNWHLLYIETWNHLASYSVAYLHTAALQSHLLDFTSIRLGKWCGMNWTDVSVLMQTWSAVRSLFVVLLNCFVCFLYFIREAIHTLQTEVTRLKDRLESCLRNKKPLTSTRTTLSAQRSSSHPRTSTPLIRLVYIF